MGFEQVFCTSKIGWVAYLWWDRLEAEIFLGEFERKLRLFAFCMETRMETLTQPWSTRVIKPAP
jgi:hypothetical protein